MNACDHPYKPRSDVQGRGSSETFVESGILLTTHLKTARRSRVVHEQVPLEDHFCKQGLFRGSSQKSVVRPIPPHDRASRLASCIDRDLLYHWWSRGDLDRSLLPASNGSNSPEEWDTGPIPHPYRV